VVVVFEGPMSAFTCREEGKRLSARSRTGYFPRSRDSRRWTRRLNLCRLIASVSRHLSSRSLYFRIRSLSYRCVPIIVALRTVPVANSSVFQLLE